MKYVLVCVLSQQLVSEPFGGEFCQLSEIIQRKSNLNGSDGYRRRKGETREIQWRGFRILEDADRRLSVPEKALSTSLKKEARGYER